MNMICPGCERPTYKPKRMGAIREAIPAGKLGAVNTMGECTTCWRDRKGIVREIVKSGVTIVQSTYRAPMTDADIEQAKRSLAKMSEARRQRGVPTEGIDPRELARPGLTLMEV